MTNEEVKFHVRSLVEQVKENTNKIEELDKLVLKHRMIVLAVGVVATVVATIVTILLNVAQVLLQGTE